MLFLSGFFSFFFLDSGWVCSLFSPHSLSKEEDRGIQSVTPLFSPLPRWLGPHRHRCSAVVHPHRRPCPAYLHRAYLLHPAAYIFWMIGLQIPSSSLSLSSNSSCSAIWFPSSQLMASLTAFSNDSLSAASILSFTPSSLMVLRMLYA